MRRISWVVTLLYIVLLWSCSTDEKVFVPDTSAIELDHAYVRWDQEIKNLDTLHLAEEIELLREKNPAFFKLYFQKILPFVGETEQDFLQNLKGYLSDDRIKKLHDTTAIVFDDFERNIRPELDQALKIFKYYFPESTTPNIYTFTSEYTFQRFIFNDDSRDGIGLGLDMFLGSDYPYKEIDPTNPSFSNYLTRAFTKKHLTKKTIETMIEDQLGNPPGSRLIDMMIHNGKMLYILDKVLPTTPDSILLEYTDAQTKWVKENEIEMWAFFFKEDLFYETNAVKIGKYINPSPTSPGMPPESPGRTGNYIGWQIVKAYMKKYNNLSILDLINEKNSQKIMDQSKYKPR